MVKIECLIVDDEPNACGLLREYIERIPFLSHKESCFDAKEALKFLQSDTADLIFLDINMPGMTGMDMMQLLPANQSVILTTAYSEYALESYQYHVIDYLLKPISFRRFMMAANKAKEIKTGSAITESGRQGKYMFVKSDKKILRLNFEDVLYMEAAKEYISIYTEGQKILLYRRMKEVEKKLPAHFKRIHNSYIINCDHIGRIEGNMVQIGTEHIPIGISFKDDFVRYIQEKAL